MVVRGSHSEATSTLYNQLQNNSSGLTTNALHNLQLAIQITASQETAYGQGQRGQNRGRNNQGYRGGRQNNYGQNNHYGQNNNGNRGNFGNRGNRGNNDVYQNIANTQVPQNRPTNTQSD